MGTMSMEVVRGEWHCMSIEEAASSLRSAASLIAVSGLKSTTAVTSSEAAAAVETNALSLGVDGGEQRGEPTAAALEGAFLDRSLGEVTAVVTGAGVGVAAVALAAAAGGGVGRLSLMKNSS